MTFPAPPAPADVARALIVMFVVSTAVLVLACWLRRSASRPAVTAFAYVLFAAGAGTLLLFGLAFVYPHHHHDLWPADRTINYVIDASIGIVFWLTFAVAYLLGWRSPRRNFG